MRRALAVAFVAVACALPAAVALAATSLSDPVGDNSAAPDLTSITVSETVEGMLTIAVGVANYQTLPQGSWVNLWFDLDSNQRTGDAGDEALVRYFDDGGLQFFRWAGSELVRQPATDMSATFAEGLLTVTGPKTAFDGASTFGLLVVTSHPEIDLDDRELVSSDFGPNRGRIAVVLPGPVSFVDVTGDHGGAPDITSVEVSDARNGMISFAIATPNFPALPQDRFLILAVDRDGRRSTGAIGAEILVVFAPGQRLFVGRWSQAEDDFVEVTRPKASARYANGVLTILLHRSVLGDVARFSYEVEAYDAVVGNEVGEQGEEGDLTAYDYAPNANANGLVYAKYALANRPPLRLIVGAPSSVPARPVAGKTLTISVPVERSDTARSIASGSVSCSVKVAGTRVNSIGRVGAGKASCSLTVPGSASGKIVSGTMTVRSAGTSHTTRFAFRVR